MLLHCRLLVVDTFAGLSDSIASDIVTDVEVPCVNNATITFEMDKEFYAQPFVDAGEVEVNGTTVIWTMDSVGSEPRCVYLVQRTLAGFCCRRIRPLGARTGGGRRGGRGTFRTS